MSHSVQSLLNFIEDARTRGLADEEIKDAANAIGLWNPSLVNAAVRGVDLTPFTERNASTEDAPNFSDDFSEFYDGGLFPDEEYFDTVDGDEGDNLLDNVPRREVEPVDAIEKIEDEDLDIDNEPRVTRSNAESNDTTRVLPSPIAANQVHNTDETPLTPHDVVAETEHGTPTDAAVPPPVPASTTPSQGQPQNTPNVTQVHGGGAGAPPHNPPTTEDDPRESKSKLPILQAVIHHVSLWAFLLCSIPSIIYLVDTLMGESGWHYNNPSTLIGFASVLLVTGGLYSVMYGIYVRKTLKHYPNLKTGKILSILTIAGSTVGAVISGTILVGTMLTIAFLGSENTGSLLVSSLLVTIMFLASVFTYVATDFLSPERPSRRILSLGAPVVTGLILVSMFILAFTVIPGAAADGRTQEDLVDTADSIVEFTEEHSYLPDHDEFAALDTPEGVTYENVAYDTYDICAVFKRNTMSEIDDLMYTYPEGINDTSISDWTFREHVSGKHCFTMQNTNVTNQPYPEPTPYPIPPITPEPLPTNPTAEPTPEPMPMPSVTGDPDDPVIGPEPSATSEPAPQPSYSLEPQPRPTYTTMPIEPQPRVNS